MKDLSLLTGASISLLAFPYGDHDPRIVEHCRQAGYRHVFTIQPTLVRPMVHDFVRGRVAVDAGDGLLDFFLKVEWVVPMAGGRIADQASTVSLKARRLIFSLSY